MNYTQFISKYTSVTKYFQEIMQKGALIRYVENGSFNMRCHNKGLSPEASAILHRVFGNSSNMLEVFTMGKVLSEGPKIFRPKQRDFEMLEQMTLNISFEDYVQPFDTVVIEFPEKYLSSKQIHCPQEGEWHYGVKAPTTHEPSFMVLHWDQETKAVISNIVFTSDFSIKTALAPKPGEIVEEYLEKFTMSELFDGSLETSEAEWMVVKDCIRASMNYCLLLDEFGVKNLGPQNPSHYKRLHKHKNLADKAGDKSRIDYNEREIRSHPMIYEIKQEVKLVRSVKHQSELSNEPTGKTMPPHHRRGYYRMQPFGEGNKQRKRIRIPPVFVNKHLFLGEQGNTSVIYE